MLVLPSTAWDHLIISGVKTQQTSIHMRHSMLPLSCNIILVIPLDDKRLTAHFLLQKTIHRNYQKLSKTQKTIHLSVFFWPIDGWTDSNRWLLCFLFTWRFVGSERKTVHYTSALSYNESIVRRHQSCCW